VPTNQATLCVLQELLIYKCLSQQMIVTADKFERKFLPPSVSSCLNTASAISVNAMTVQDGDFVLVSRINLTDPILALRKIDMTGDGLLEIGVLSLKGLHILQVFLVHLDVETLLDTLSLGHTVTHCYNFRPVVHSLRPLTL